MKKIPKKCVRLIKTCDYSTTLIINIIECGWRWWMFQKNIYMP